jgi:hypothetical protein
MGSMRVAVTGFTLMVLAVTDCYAKCAGFPATSHTQADVEVWSCVSVTFNSVNRKFYNFGLLYENGASFSGTLMAVNVNSSHVVIVEPEAQKQSGNVRAWKKGEALTVFVPAAAEDVCPSGLPSDLRIETREQCCDTLPMHGQCLVPKFLQIVDVVPK